jgi:hypothetical protein
MDKFPIKSLKGLSIPDQFNFIQKWFRREFICDSNNNKIYIKTHDGKRVIFKDYKYNHAYTKENSQTGQREIDYTRLRHIHLIKETLKLRNNPLFKDGTDIKHGDSRRWYLDPQRNYFLILKRMRGGNFLFISAYFMQSAMERNKKNRFMRSP